MYACLLRNRSDRPRQSRHFRNRAQVMRSGLYCGNRDHRRLKDFDAASNICLQRKDDFRSDRNRINSVVRLCRMSGAPFDCDPERTCSGHDRPGSAKNLATWVSWRDVNSKCAVRRAVAVEQTFLDHQSRSSVTLLSGLESEDDTPCNVISMHSKKACRTDEHRRVSIMAARVHRTIDF